MRKRGIIGTLLLLVYLAGVGLFTGPSLAQIFLGRLPQPRLELIPFADMISVLTDKNAVGLGAFVNIAGNIALLFPLGLFLPLFWRWFERAGRTIGWCFGTSLSIELIQLVAGGVTSADDLLLNTLGALLGYALFAAARRLWPRFCTKCLCGASGRARMHAAAEPPPELPAAEKRAAS